MSYVISNFFLIFLKKSFFPDLTIKQNQSLFLSNRKSSEIIVEPGTNSSVSYSQANKSSSLVWKKF
jgi:hypothetical protein